MTAESLKQLLNAFSSDPAAAGDAFQKLRESLNRYFTVKGDSAPETATDETLDRVARKISEGTAIEDMTKYGFAAARFVYLERLRLEQKQTTAAKTFYEAHEARAKGEERDDFALMRECFGEMSEADRQILRNYFADLPSAELVVRRQDLIDEQQITLNQMRLKIFRLRKRLQNCVRGKLDS